MKTFKLNTKSTKLLADTVTPVSIYLRLRDQFANSLLLESSDYHGGEDSFSFICCEPIAEFIVKDENLSITYPDNEKVAKTLAKPADALEELGQFIASFKEDKNGHKFNTNGLYGYTAYDGVQYFEDIAFNKNKAGDDIPQICYQAFRFVVAVNHNKSELHIFEHTLEGDDSPSRLDEIKMFIDHRNFPVFQFSREGEETSSFTDEEFLKILNKGIDHCNRGDVFQIVLSRRFRQNFKGDEFNVYRALRSINPSPYLFYFDYGSFKIFGSSPEAQLIISDKKATIHPIAGTFRRTGNDEADAELAKKLLADPKENAEHVMLVDLARNDLSRNGKDVEVEVYKEIQYYSHVIHLVSKVNGYLSDDTESIKVVADTFPAGTLSGAPKYKAMELIDKYEQVSRSYYGGAIGYIGFDGEFNHAIMIRSFLSANNQLQYQAGAGVVAKSDPDSELQEVHNKLAALKSALEMAEGL